MEAKGCAKSAVWKDARRYFYWALRARLAKSNALKAFAEASPDMDLDDRTALLEHLTSIDEESDNRSAATTLESFDLAPTITKLKAEHLMRRMVDMAHQDRKATISGLVRFVDNLSEDEKASLRAALQGSPRSPGVYQSSLAWTTCSHLTLV
jgi:acetyl-CoA carboxylase/biotin carboxylase 1